MFGQGIYFADSYDKAIGYSSETDGVRFIMLCEVALGKMKCLKKAEQVRDLPNKSFQSVMGQGRQNPDQSQALYDHNGAEHALG